MARRQEEAENHWPGFVDALSTIVMVVTFLLIILGIVIFALSLQMAKSMEEAKFKGQKSGQEVSNTTIAGVEGKSGRFKQSKGKEVLADKAVESETKLAIRSQIVKKSKEITVAADETALDNPKATGIKITAAKEVLTLIFSEKTVKIDDKSNTEITDFVAKNPDIPKGAKLEIWSFAQSNVGSISEARRLAYYRAMSVRNSLLTTGMEGKQISVRVRETDDDAMAHKIKVFVKP